MPRVASHPPDPKYNPKDYAVGKFDPLQETKMQAQRINMFLGGMIKSSELTEDLRDAFRRAAVSARFSENQNRAAVVETRNKALRAQKLAEEKLKQKEAEVAALLAELAEAKETQLTLEAGYVADVQTLASIVSTIEQDNQSKHELQLRLNSLTQENICLMMQLRDALVAADRSSSENELLRIDYQHRLALVDAWFNPAYQPLQARTFPQD